MAPREQTTELGFDLPNSFLGQIHATELNFTTRIACVCQNYDLALVTECDAQQGRVQFEGLTIALRGLSLLERSMSHPDALVKRVVKHALHWPDEIVGQSRILNWDAESAILDIEFDVELTIAKFALLLLKPKSYYLRQPMRMGTGYYVCGRRTCFALIARPNAWFNTTQPANSQMVWNYCGFATDEPVVLVINSLDQMCLVKIKLLDNGVF